VVRELAVVAKGAAVREVETAVETAVVRELAAVAKGAAVRAVERAVVKARGAAVRVVVARVRVDKVMAGAV
jgi:hypothetical protein